MGQAITNPTMRPVWFTKTQISHLFRRAGWSESLLSHKLYHRFCHALAEMKVEERTRSPCMYFEQFYEDHLWHTAFPYLCQVWTMYSSHLGKKIEHCISSHAAMIKVHVSKYNMTVWCFTSLSTLFKSYRDDGRVIMKGSVQGSAIQSWAEFRLQWDSNPGLHKSEVRSANQSATWGLYQNIRDANQNRAEE